jgi:flagellar biosynthesis protein FliQ
MMDQPLTLLADLLWNALLISAPIFIVALVVGTVISVLQVATRIGALMVLSPIWTSIAAPAHVRVL